MKTQIDTTMSIRKSLLWFETLYNLLNLKISQIKIANIQINTGCFTEDMADYMTPIIRRKPNIILVRTDTNDLTNSVNTMK